MTGAGAEYLRLRPRCVYDAGGQPVADVLVIPLPCEVMRYLVIYRGEFYAFSFKEEVREFLKGRLDTEAVEVRPCR
jgi:hypothetical protein